MHLGKIRALIDITLAELENHRKNNKEPIFSEDPSTEKVYRLGLELGELNFARRLVELLQEESQNE